MGSDGSQNGGDLRKIQQELIPPATEIGEKAFADGPNLARDHLRKAIS